MRSAYVFVDSQGHDYPGHPECPRRFDLLRERLAGLDSERLESQPAALDDVASVHTRSGMAAIEAACSNGPGVIDYAPTYVTSTSFGDALGAAGGALTCTRAVLGGRVAGAFAIVRPPGHHAEAGNAMDFCIFNNIAIAARHALASGLDRVMIVDYDAHHGNGTQAAFLSEEGVAFISLHQWGIYPGTGWFQEAPQAKKRIVNVPLESGAGDETYARVLDGVVRPVAELFRPKMLFVSAGFDAHWRDPLTNLGLSTAGFFAMSTRLVQLAAELCEGRIVFVLEGGYDPQNLANGVTAVMAALSGEGHGPAVKDVCPYAEPDAGGRIEDVIRWHGLQDTHATAQMH